MDFPLYTQLDHLKDKIKSLEKDLEEQLEEQQKEKEEGYYSNVKEESDFIIVMVFYNNEPMHAINIPKGEELD